MTSVSRLHDATNAYLSMKLGVAKQAANDMALKEVDKFCSTSASVFSCDHFWTRRSKSTFWQDQAYGLEPSVHHAFFL